MGKISKKKAAPAKASKAPSRAPASKSGSKKRVSSKAAAAPQSGGILSAISDAMSSGSLPPLPSIGSVTGSSSIQYNPSTGTFHRRKKSRKGLSASDIKGFMRVNKFAGMLTKVTGKKHHVVTHRKRR